MSKGLVRLQNKGHLHFVTFSCFRHRSILGTPQARNTLLHILHQTSSRYEAIIVGYVIMPDHVHLLLTEPELKPLSTAIQVLKQTFSRTRPEPEIWEKRYYDFNIYTHAKLQEKLNYIHRNPVVRGLVSDPSHWRWSSFRAHALRETAVQLTLPAL